MRTCFTLLASFAIIFVTKAQSVVILQPGSDNGKDAMVGNYFDYVDQNFGDLPELEAYAWTAAGLNTDMRFLIEFDLSVIPAGSVIDEARLTLYYDPATWWGGGIHTGDNDAYVSRIIEPWDENIVTWNTQPATTELHRITLPSSISPTQDYNIKIKKLIQDMVNDPENSHGLMVQLVDETQYKSLLFCSSDYADASNHPKLRIKYTEPLKISASVEIDPVFSPNPFSESTTLNFNNTSGDSYTFKLIDLQGSVVYEQNNFTGNSITVFRNDLAPGIYLWNLRGADNRIKSGKIVVQ